MFILFDDIRAIGCNSNVTVTVEYIQNEKNNLTILIFDNYAFNKCKAISNADGNIVNFNFK